jgi:hypothetical protein
MTWTNDQMKDQTQIVQPSNSHFLYEIENVPMEERGECKTGWLWRERISHKTICPEYVPPITTEGENGHNNILTTVD